jgi:hypothetical protein
LKQLKLNTPLPIANIDACCGMFESLTNLTTFGIDGKNGLGWLDRIRSSTKLRDAMGNITTFVCKIDVVGRERDLMQIVNTMAMPKSVKYIVIHQSLDRGASATDKIKWRRWASNCVRKAARTLPGIDVKIYTHVE